MRAVKFPVTVEALAVLKGNVLGRILMSMGFNFNRRASKAVLSKSICTKLRKRLPKPPKAKKTPTKRKKATGNNDGGGNDANKEPAKLKRSDAVWVTATIVPAPAPAEGKKDQPAAAPDSSSNLPAAAPSAEGDGPVA